MFSSSLEEHVDHLRQVLLLCRQHGLMISLHKCEFVVPEIEFLGHVLSATGCSPLTKHSAAISVFPPPSDKPALQRFLGMVNFYRKFLQGAARVLAPLTDALKGPGKTLTWSPDLEAAFHHAKVLELIHPHSSAPVSLAVDTSDSNVGAVLQQRVDDAWFPLAFFSRKLSDAVRKYSAFERQHLAAYLSIRHFHFMLERRKFLLFTDHKPLTSALFRSLCPGQLDSRDILPMFKFSPTIVSLPPLNPSPPQLQVPPLSPEAKCPSPTEDPASEVSAVSAVSAGSAVSAVSAVSDLLLLLLLLLHQVFKNYPSQTLIFLRFHLFNSPVP